MKTMFDDKTALLVIDMTNDFVKKDGALPVPGAEDIIPSVSRLINEARGKGTDVIFVCDSHEPDDPEFEKWPPHCIKGTVGAAPHKNLGFVSMGKDIFGGDIYIPKTKFSGFHETLLNTILQTLDIKKLVLTGVVTNICILATAFDALHKGYEVTVVKEGVTGLNDNHHEYALELMEVIGVRVV
jgi:nicotinamidase/pyrazinamidase